MWNPIWQGEVEPTAEDLDDLIEQSEALPNVEWAQLDGRFMNIKHADGFVEMWLVIPYDGLSWENESIYRETAATLAIPLSDSRKVVGILNAALVQPLAVSGTA